MAILSLLLAGVLAIVSVQATPLERRGTVGTDVIIGLAEAVPSGSVGTIYKAYQPLLKVVNGCVPYPGVDALGNTKYLLSLFGTS